MKDHLISIFIDDELALDEKVELIRAICGRPGFKETALNLIDQERRLRSEVVPAASVPPVQAMERRGRLRLRTFLRPVLTAAVIVLVALTSYFYFDRLPDSQAVPHRFVVYRPDAAHVAIAGSFTGWEPLPLQKAGISGYWELTLSLPAGEHRFTYLLENGKMFADPTLPTREKDDFGGENSVLTVSAG